ncbi:MAG: DUF1836 domain-containing protein [Erysipelotrichaceae bacterium]
MENRIEQFEGWKSAVLQQRLARWDDLPELDLYMDQVLIYVEKQLGIIAIERENLITASMINNYVKAGLIPKPHKKKYNKVHIAYIIAITVLKQVMPIIQVRNGIQFTAKAHGEKGAYNLFCEEMEHAFYMVLEHDSTYFQQTKADNPLQIDLALKFLAMAYASKSVGLKIIELQGEQ